VTASDPAGLRRRLERLQQHLGQRRVDDPVIQAAVSELAGIADRFRVESGRLRKAQAALDADRDRLSEERRRSQVMFDVAPEACLVTTLDGIVLQVNAAASELLGDSQSARRPLVLRFAPDDRARVHALATTSSHGRSTEPAIVTLVRRKQHSVRVELRCVAIGDDQLLWHVRDVTEQEAARERLELAIARERDVSKQLRELDEARTAFLLAVSHDLQAPLAGMAGLAGLLLERPRIAAGDRHRMIQQILSSAESLISDLRGLLDLERLHRGDIGIERRSVDLGSLLEPVAKSTDLGDRHLVVEAEATTAALDPVVVRRIIDNLLANATRHTPAGTTVSARLCREPDGILLIVEDDGPGVPEGLRDRVFDLFTRDRKGGGGLGVGLALVRQFAELHGGTARVEPRRGGGASFHVLLREGPAASRTRR
jgi:PAS domain S-box-containing protein